MQFKSNIGHYETFLKVKGITKRPTLNRTVILFFRGLFDGQCVFHVLYLAPIPVSSVGPPPGGSAAA